MAKNRKFQNFIETAFIQSSAVNNDALGSGAVGNDEILNDAITNSKLDVSLMKCVKLVYDFDTDGGNSLLPFIPLNPASATQEAALLPANAVVVDAYIEVVTPMTSAGLATIKVGITTDDDAFLGSTAFDDASLGANKVVQANNAVPFKMIAGETPQIAIATADLTAGKLNLFIHYHEGN